MNEVQQLKARLEVYHADNVLKTQYIVHLKREIAQYEEMNETNNKIIKVNDEMIRTQNILIKELKELNDILEKRSNTLVSIISKI